MSFGKLSGETFVAKNWSIHRGASLCHALKSINTPSHCPVVYISRFPSAPKQAGIHSKKRPSLQLSRSNTFEMKRHGPFMKCPSFPPGQGWPFESFQGHGSCLLTWNRCPLPPLLQFAHLPFYPASIYTPCPSLPASRAKTINPLISNFLI